MAKASMGRVVAVTRGRLIRASELGCMLLNHVHDEADDGAELLGKARFKPVHEPQIVGHDDARREAGEAGLSVRQEAGEQRDAAAAWTRPHQAHHLPAPHAALGPAATWLEPLRGVAL